MKITFKTPLETLKIGPCLWIVTAPMFIKIDDITYVVPAGFLTDGASVPRALRALISPMGSAMAEGAVLHDWFYSKEGPASVDQKESDRYFKEVGRARGASAFIANCAWSGVRAFGSFSFRKMASIEKVKDSYFNGDSAATSCMNGRELLLYLKSTYWKLLDGNADIQRKVKK